MNDRLIGIISPKPYVDDNMKCCHPCTYPTRFMIGWLYILNSIIIMVIGFLLISYSTPQIGSVINQLHDKNDGNCSVNLEINVLEIAEMVLSIYWITIMFCVLGLPMIFVFIFLPIARKECSVDVDRFIR